MKVLCVNSSIDPKSGGGTAERTVKLAKHLKRCGVEVAILTSDVGVTDRLRHSLHGIELHILPLFIDRYPIPRFTYRSLKKIVQKADIIHLMNHWTFFNAAIYVLCRILHTPYVVCPAGALPIFGRSRMLKKIYNVAVGRSIIRQASAHVGITDNEKKQFQDYGIDPETVVIIPNGVNTEEFVDNDDDAFRKKYSIGSNPFILFLGRLNRIKGPDLLLTAFAGIKPRFPEYHLVYAGPDEGMLDVLKKIVKNEDLGESVHFIGYIGGKEKSWAYHSAELLAVTSRQEAMSIVALEAGCAGTPLLLTDVCGFDQIVDINGGIVVTPDISDIQRGLYELLSHRQRLKEMGSALNDFVLSNYTWDVVVNQYIGLFNKICDMKPVPCKSVAVLN
jgi:glycosyltransferase involved in cell wall biosynthesis